MSVNPVATAQWSTVPKKGGEPRSAPVVPFEEVFSRTSASGGAEPVSAAEAAGILRLKMLSSALSLGSDQESQQSASLGVQGLLNRFLAQLPETSAPVAPVLSSVAEPGRAAGPVVAPGVALPTPAPADALVDKASSRSGVDAVVEKASRRYGVDAGLIKAIIKAESNFNPRAVSSAGAQGLMQLMPATARGLGVSDPFDPEQNVMAGTRFLKDMLHRYGGNLDDALAAYNWGPGNVDRHGSASLPRETRQYLGTVKGYYAQYLG